MSFESQQEIAEISPIIQAKALLSKGKKKKAFAVLKKAAWNDRNVMACYDCAFMMFKGIGCQASRRYDLEGLWLLCNGMDLEKEPSKRNWKSDGSVTELFGRQKLSVACLFLLMTSFFESLFIVLNSHINGCYSTPSFISINLC